LTPVGREAEDIGYISHRFGEHSRQRTGRHVPPLLYERNDVKVSGGPVDEAEQQEPATADCYDLKGQSPLKENVAESLQRLIE